MNYDPDYLASPELPLFSSTPYQYNSYSNYPAQPLKPCLKRPVNSNRMSAADRMYYTNNRKKMSTPSAFQPFSTIREDLIWDPYDEPLLSHYDNHDISGSRSFHDLNNLSRPTNFRSEISRFTESLYNLAKPTPIKPRGQFPRVERYPHNSNISNILNPGLPMKPVQNLDRINPFTGLPNIEFIPTTEYLELGTTSTYLPDGTPSPDTTSRRVAAILEPTETYSDLVHHFHTKKSDQHNLQLLEHQLGAMTLQLPQYTVTPSLTVSTPYNYLPTMPTTTMTQTMMYPNQLNPYQTQTPMNKIDPTFLGSQYPSNNAHYRGQTSAHLTTHPQYVSTQHLNMTSNMMPTNNVGQMNQSTIPFDQSQLDQAWLQLSNELQQQKVVGHASGSNPNYSSNYQSNSYQNNSYQSKYNQEPPLQGVLDMMSIDRISNLTKPVCPGSSWPNPSPNLSIHRNDLTPTPVKNNQKSRKKLENVYDELLKLPKMPKSPSELEPIASSEDELTRYNERRRDNLLTLMNRRDHGNVDLRKYQLSAKYQETKYVENRILGHVPSILADLNKLDLNKKMNDKNKEMDKTLRQISRSYEDRCKQRQKMKSTLSLVKEIPKMVFDSSNKLVAKEGSAKLTDIKKSKDANKVKVDDMEIEVNDDIMSMIYHKALKDKVESKTGKHKTRERRRSKAKALERSCESSSEAEISEIMKSRLLNKPKLEDYALVHDVGSTATQKRYSPYDIPEDFVAASECGQQKSQKSANRKINFESKGIESPRKTNEPIKSCDSSSEAEICEIMKSDIFKQKLEDYTPDVGMDAKLKCLQRYSPRINNKLLPVMEADQQDVNKSLRNKDHIESKHSISNGVKPLPIHLVDECKFLSIDEPVPSPAPEAGQKAILVQTPDTEIAKTFRDHGDVTKMEQFRKTKSSGVFENIPKLTITSKMENVKRTNSDPISVHEEEVQNVVEKKSLNISKTAKKHLGMAMTPIGKSDSVNEMDNFVKAIQISSDDTPSKNFTPIKDVSDNDQRRIMTPGHDGVTAEKFGSIKSFCYSNYILFENATVLLFVNFY